jgi:hypothetical protein
MRVLADFHHGSLLRSLVMLFEDRLGMELYRPIGLQWLHRGYWAISNLKGTAKQFLDLVPSLEAGGRKRADQCACEDDRSGAFDDREINREDLVHQAQHGVEGRLDGVEPINRDVPVQDLLEDLGIGHEPLPLGDAPFNDR